MNIRFFSQNEIDKIVAIALEAGEIAAKSFKKKDFTISKKSDNSNVTSADIKVDQFINQKLTYHFPNIPIISEELPIKEINSDIFWLVDPIDGTSSFIKGINQFSINIALIKNQKPVFGLIYAPLFEDSIMAHLNHESKVILTKNQKQYFYQKPTNKNHKLKVVTSTNTKDQDIFSYLNQNYQNINKDYQVEKLSSAIKFLRILENNCDLFLHLKPSMEWDTASGQALIEAINGRVKTLDYVDQKILPGSDLTYQKLNFTNQPFIAYL